MAQKKCKHDNILGLMVAGVLHKRDPTLPFSLDIECQCGKIIRVVDFKVLK